MSTQSALDALSQWIEANPGVFAYDHADEGLVVMEIESGKKIAIDKHRVAGFEAKLQQDSGKPYLVLLFDAGHQLVVSDQGFAFEPDFTNTGPIQLPVQVVCMRDYTRLFGELVQFSKQSSEKDRALELVMLLIAMLDGARRVGLDVEREERQLDQVLQGIESGSSFVV